jgi:hypothetical protein
MMHAPTDAAIDAAELRAAIARQDIWNHAHRARLALNEKLSRPSTWAIVVAVGAGGAWLFYQARSRKVPEPRDESTRRSGETSAAALVAALAARYVAKFLIIYAGETWLAASRRAMHADRSQPGRQRNV